MTLPSLIWGSPQWMAVTLGLVGLATAVLLWSYTRAEAKRSVQNCRRSLESPGFYGLAISLLEPLLTGSKPRRGANAFVILADNSQSLQIRDGDGTGTNGDWMRGLLRGESAGRRGWVRITTFAAMFLTRTFAPWTDSMALTFDGTGQHGCDVARGACQNGFEACRLPAFCSLPTATVPIWRSGSHRACRRSIRSYPRRDRRPGCRRRSSFDQSDQFRVGTGRDPSRRYRRSV